MLSISRRIVFFAAACTMCFCLTGCTGTGKAHSGEITPSPQQKKVVSIHGTGDLDDITDALLTFINEKSSCTVSSSSAKSAPKYEIRFYDHRSNSTIADITLAFSDGGAITELQLVTHASLEMTDTELNELCGLMGALTLGITDLDADAAYAALNALSIADSGSLAALISNPPQQERSVILKSDQQEYLMSVSGTSNILTFSFIME